MSDCNSLVIAIMAAAVAIPCGAKDNHAQASTWAVEVRVFDLAHVPPELLEEAEQEASRIFRPAGIELDWTSGSPLHAEAHQLEYRAAPASGAPAPLTCGGTPNVCRLDVRISVYTPTRLRPGELAEALPFAHSGIRVNIFYDRVQKVLNGHGNAGSGILGHVLAHEIGHVLLGTDRHGRLGLMRASWDDACFNLMASAPLSFTPDEMRSMQQRLKTRQAALTGVDRPLHVAKLVAMDNEIAEK